MKDRRLKVAIRDTFRDAEREAKRIAQTFSISATVEWDDAAENYGIWIDRAILDESMNAGAHLPATSHRILVADFCVASNDGNADARLIIPMTEKLAARIQGSNNALLHLRQKSVRLTLNEPYILILLDSDAQADHLLGYPTQAELTDPEIVLIDPGEDSRSEIFAEVTVQASSDCMEQPELLSRPWREQADSTNTQGEELQADVYDDEPIMFLGHRRYSNITVERHVCDLHLEVDDDLWRRVRGTLRAMWAYEQRGVTIDLPPRIRGFNPGKNWNEGSLGSPEGYQFTLRFEWLRNRNWTISVVAVPNDRGKLRVIPFMAQTQDREHEKSMEACTGRKTTDWIL